MNASQSILAQRIARKDIHQSVSLDAETHELLTILAQRRGISRSDLVRKSLRLLAALDARAGLGGR